MTVSLRLEELMAEIDKLQQENAILRKNDLEQDPQTLEQPEVQS